MGNCQNVPEDESKKTSTKLKGKPQIFIKTYTWPRDSHGLFDYECKNVSKRNIKTSGPGKLTRVGNDVQLVKEDHPVAVDAQNDKDLMKLNIKEGNFWINACYEGTKIKKIDQKPVKIENPEDDLENIDDNVWIVVKSLKATNNNKGYKLCEGDLIKLGRVKFRIKEIRTSPYDANSKAKADSKHTKVDEENNVSVVGEDSNGKKNGSKDLETPSSKNNLNAKMCRICLFENCEPNDPFLSPCACSGTMKHIHIRCLQKWLRSRLHVKVSGPATSIYWKSFECELCKTTYPGSFDVDGKRYDLIEIDKPDSAYIILEILSKDKNLSRGVHVIKMETKNNIRLGRGHDSDIRITDISVSRCHAVIKLEKGSFYIEDNNSKFGTLVYVRKPLPLMGDFNNVWVQIGRTVLSFTVKRNWTMLPACFSSSKSNVDTNHENDEKEESDEMIFEPANNQNGIAGENHQEELDIIGVPDDDGARADDIPNLDGPDEDDPAENNSNESNHNEVAS